MGTTPQGERLNAVRKAQASKKAMQVWRLYHDPEGGTVDEIAEKVGISRRTAFRYLQAMNLKYAEEQADHVATVRNDRIATLTTMEERAARMFFDEDDPEKAAKWAGVVKDCGKQLGMLLGLDAPTKVDVRDVTFTPTEIALIVANATPEERPRVAAGDVAVGKAILERARAGASR